MSRKNVLAWLTAVITTLALAPTAAAQQARDLRTSEEIRSPFIEPDYFDPDFQFFAPADVEAYDDLPEFATGWFFTYDRATMNVSRGSQQLRPWEGDFTWGNRYEMGYMTNDDHGWLMTIWHIDGASTSENLLEESGDADITSFELNKTWRRHLHSGAILEPMIGFRYAKFEEDFFNVDNVVPAGGVTTGTNNVFSHTENNMVGGVLGARMAKQHGHWHMSSDVRVFAAYNFEYNQFDATFDPVVGNNSSVRIATDANQFILGGNVNANASYVITRDVSLNFGFSLMYFGRGVGRVNISNPSNTVTSAPTPQTNYEDDQDLTAVGFSFGIAVNR